jgi:superfamily II DNA/RNA helicase
MTSGFKIFNISQRLIDKLNERRITIPTKIQEQVIPKIQNGQDVIGQSRSGTGKTLAYLIPLIEITEKSKEKCLIIAPTNELARQIYQELTYYSSDADISNLLLSGGENIEKHINDLKKNFDFIVSVPGRILKLVENGSLKLSMIKRIVLDEADFLIDLGFVDDLEKILAFSKNINQLMIFSATLSKNTKHLLNIIHTQKYSARVDSQNTLPDNIENYFFPVTDENREKTLFKIIERINPYLAIIFARTKETGKYIYAKLHEKKVSAIYLSGELSPGQRKKALKDFRNAKYQYLVATDLASRGLDIESITHIINYNLPVNEIDYLHRAGRTGRKDEKGIVYSLCNELDEGYLKKYAIKLNFQINAVKLNKDEIVVDPHYKGVKPRLNLQDLKLQEKKSGREKLKNVFKAKRNKKRR